MQKAEQPALNSTQSLDRNIFLAPNCKQLQYQIKSANYQKPVIDCLATFKFEHKSNKSKWNVIVATFTIFILFSINLFNILINFLYSKIFE